ncbi:MAG TPA: hypothetical protein VJ983_10840 [candidate division Zixibacteria bacterium]|nr:hypothetical protein [candidate division Zixibacteria bacterium]
MEAFSLDPGSWLGLLGSVGLLLVGHVAKKYIIPFLSVGNRKQYATYIATIADEVTDDLRSKYPDKEWLQHLDEAIDALISICGISEDIARRAINASVARK